MTTRALLQTFVILLPICGALAQEAPVIPPMARSLAEQPDPAKDIPKALGDWFDWATWDEDDSPAYFNDENRKIPVWVSQLDLSVTETGGTFSLPVTTFRDTWAPLPGDLAAWPLGVSAGGKNLPVMERNKLPCVYLEQGEWRIEGTFRWEEMPQSMMLPPTIGVLQLTRSGQRIDNPTWESKGMLWLKRTTNEEADKNYLDVQVYRNLADGSPLWLHTDIELTVTGKSREEELGTILPEGWRLSSLDSPIPCAIDDYGLVKTQVRAGKWTISLAAFRTTPAQTVQYAAGAKPITEEELISLQNLPNFRLVEFSEILAVDAAQTTFPDKWKQFPLHLWDNTKPFNIVEKMRGMGQRKPPGVTISRSFWLDEDGKELTYRDIIKGNSLQTWRLDAAPGQRLGAAKIGEDSQLITKNPVNNATGVEVRVRNLNLQSVGRMNNSAKIPATGWQLDAESLDGTLYLPPGWRAFGIFGADSSYGDWLSNWSLLDVFLLLIFTVAIFRLWGWKLSLIGCLAFALAYHESGVPRFGWALLVVAIVIANTLKTKKQKSIAQVIAYAAVVIVLLQLVPFSIKQVQQALYPQLERLSTVGTRDWLQSESLASQSDVYMTENESSSRGVLSSKKGWSKKNLNYDSKAKIQTGPAVPEWSWRKITFNWSGPVSARENISFVLIPRWLQRILTVARVVLLFLLLYGLIARLGGGKGFVKVLKLKVPKPAAASAASLLFCLCLLLPQPTQAQFPDQDMLDTLKQRLDTDPTGLSQYAQIPEVDLKLNGRNLSMTVHIHAVKATAVPLPGRLPVWSPLSVTEANGKAATVVRRDGFLWGVVQSGTHTLQVEGLVPAGDWEWSFLLKPQYVNIDAPQWTVSGVEANGIPENQIFFVEQNRSQDAEAAYDRKDFNPVFKVDRSLELGLLWEATTTVRRLSPLGKAVSLSLPLLPGEHILTPGLTARNGRIEIRLGAQEKMATWLSQVTQEPQIILLAESNDRWVEEWQVLTSAIWNISLQGLAPIYESQAAEVVPIWKPWPGESATLNIARPEAIAGDTLTIRQAIHKMSLGSRQRTSSLKLSLQNSLGMDFVLTLAEQAEVSSLKLNGQESPVRQEGNQVIVPLRPGEQLLELVWKMPSSFRFVTLGDEVGLPVECANTSTVMKLSPDQRWVLWTQGPLRGPAVRMWPLLISILLFGWLLGRVPYSPLKGYEWMILFLGLTQIPIIAGAIVVAWLFWVSFKSHPAFGKAPNAVYNINQLLILGGAVPVVVILLWALHTGLLGAPKMRIVGEGSTARNLEWFQARGENQQLPIPKILSVSIWFYRAFMLLWAVWLAFALLRWTTLGWQQLSNDSLWKRSPKRAKKPSTKSDKTPPPLPGKKKPESESGQD